MSQTGGPVVVQQLGADDEAFLRRVARAERWTARSGPRGWLVRAGSRAGRRVRRTAPRVAGLVLVLVALSGLVVGTPAAPAAPAQAGFLNKFCDRKEFNPERADFGMTGSALHDTWRNRDVKPTTKLGQYGTAGLQWTTFWLDCFSWDGIVDGVAYFIFDEVHEVADFAIVVFLWTFGGDLLDVFLRDNGSGAALDQMIRQVHADVYLQLFSVAVIIGATVVAWRWLFSQASASDILGRFAAMILVAGFALFYGGVPGGNGPNAGVVLRTLNDWTNDITSVVLAAFAGTDCETPRLPGDPGTEANRQNRRQLALDCAAEALYEVMLYEPWVVGMIGKYERAPRGADGKRGEPTKDEQLALRMLRHGAYSFQELQDNGNDHRRYIDARDIVDENDEDICDDFDAAYDHRWKGSYTQKSCDRADMRQKEFGVDDDQLAEKETDYGEVSPKNADPRYWENWSGGNSGNRFRISVLALIGAISIGLVILTVSVAYLMLQFATVMLALMAPVAFLFGLIPGFGMQVFLRWLELLLGTFIKRIVLGLFVGLLMSLYSVVLTLNAAWLLKLVLICIIAGVGLTYRKKFTEAFTLNFSGSTAFHQDGEIGDKVSGMLKGVGGLGLAAAGGGVASRQMGQSFARGALTGIGRGIAPKRAVQEHDSQLVNRSIVQGGRMGRDQYADFQQQRSRRPGMERAQQGRDTEQRQQGATQAQILAELRRLTAAAQRNQNQQRPQAPSPGGRARQPQAPSPGGRRPTGQQPRRPYVPPPNPQSRRGPNPPPPNPPRPNPPPRNPPPNPNRPGQG